MKTYSTKFCYTISLLRWGCLPRPLAGSESVLFGHAAMGRICGYGLKYRDDFKHGFMTYVPDIPLDRECVCL